MDTVDIINKEKKLMSEAKYRNYMSNIDKALKNFEYSSEWADLISALGKLSKAITSNAQYSVIPRRIKISKRLAQCMHPALPSGVHLKALETYAVIFSKMGPESLATELFIYSAGLFPLLSYAAMNVRPYLLGIYETYFVPLGEKLRPALSGFLSGVLPGYENGLDHFERTSSLLNLVCATVNPTYFYTVLWECMATNSFIRLPAITYLLEHYNKRDSVQKQIFVLGDNRDMMMSGLCACLNDSLILVQRNTLEFLLLGVPIHTELLTESELVKLVTNSLNTILRRDMSLNRRLYSWLLGNETLKNSPTYEVVSTNISPSSVINNDEINIEENSNSYFEKYSRCIVEKAFISILKFSLKNSPVDLKPYRIMVSLLDKTEIGNAILNNVLCDIIRTMSLSSSNPEVIKSGNLLFGVFDPVYIWSFMTKLYERACEINTKLNTEELDTRNAIESTSATNHSFQCIVGSGEPEIIEICYLTEFLLETISLEIYNETTSVYLPRVFLAIMQLLSKNVQYLTNNEVTASLKLVLKIVSRVQPTIGTPIKISHGKEVQNIDIVNNNKRHETVNNNEQNFDEINKLNLEKSKSDSKLDQFVRHTSDDKNSISQVVLKFKDNHENHIKHSNSNQYMENKSPTKKKKAKSYSKLFELDKEIGPNIGEVIDVRQSSGSDLGTPTCTKKTKARHKQERLRLSPKKARPSELQLSYNAIKCNRSHSTTNEHISVEDNYVEQSGISKLISQTNIENIILQDNKLNHEAKIDSTDCSILEKCIRQYEIFFEIYLSQKVLQITQDVCIESFDIGKTKENLKENHKMHIIEKICQDEYICSNACPSCCTHIDKLFETLKIRIINRSRHLHHLLNRSLMLDPIKQSTTYTFDNSSNNKNNNEYDEYCVKNQPDDWTKTCLRKILKLQISDNLRTTVKLAMNVLVEMSTFPNYNKSITSEKMEKELPNWLKVLCLIACYTQKDKELQLAGITTLFDLFSLLRSQLGHVTSPGVTFLVIQPLLVSGHVLFIERRTRIFQLLTSILWDYLGECDAIESTQICSLLYQLHNCLDSGLVEKIIEKRMFVKNMPDAYERINTDGYENLENMNASDIGQERILEKRITDTKEEDAPAHILKNAKAEGSIESESISFMKYDLLWYAGRDNLQKCGFEKLQFKVFDTLALPPYMSLRICVKKWLKSALSRGDLSRLIKPLYKILLAPNTKRVGIGKVHLLQKDQYGCFVPESDSKNSSKNELLIVNNLGTMEHDVFAVSSEYGNIRYHIDTSVQHKKRSPIRTLHKKIFGVALNNKNKTSNFVSDQTLNSNSSHSEIEPNNIIFSNNSPTNSQAIGVIVNPMNEPFDFDEDLKYENENISETDNKLNFRPQMYNKIIGNSRLLERSSNDNDCMDCKKNDFDSDNVEHILDHVFTEDSDSSTYYSDTEKKDTSIEKEESKVFNSLLESKVHSINDTLNLKRFVGHCEGVLLSQLERSKKCKTYHLKQEKASSEIDVILCNTDEGMSRFPINNNNTHVSNTILLSDENTVEEKGRIVDENFNADDEEVKIFVEDLIKQIPNIDTPEYMNNIKKRKKKHTKNKIAIMPIKTSEEHDSSINIMNAMIDGQNECKNLFNYEQCSDEETLLANKMLNMQDKQQSINLNKCNIQRKSADWTLTQEAIEKSKQNLEILRQTVSTSKLAETDNKRSSSIKSYTSNESSRRSIGGNIPQHFQNHLLLYTNVYDTAQSLYALHTLRNIISSDPRTFLCLSITTSLSSSSLKQLLTRHRKSIAGKSFISSISTTEFAQSCRGSMHLEIILLLCLFYVRSFFHIDARDSAGESPTLADILGNCRVQLECLELLTLICNELIDIVKGIGKSLACYLADLLNRCKLQKIILHCLYASVNTYDEYYQGNSIAERITNFNNLQDDNLHAKSFQIQLLRLLILVIKLENEVTLLKNDSSHFMSNTNSERDEKDASPSPICVPEVDESINSYFNYLPDCLISQQPMFLTTVLSALKDERLRILHNNWTELITISLNCFHFGSLTNIVISVIHQLCNNIDNLSKKSLKDQIGLPADYVISQIEAITILCHYCLLDNPQQTSFSHLFNQIYPQSTSILSQPSNSAHLFNSIMHSLLPSVPTTNNNNQQERDSQSSKNLQLIAARNAVLSHLPRIISSMAGIWNSELGELRHIKQQLIEFLSPISLHYGTNFLAGIAVAWHKRGEKHRQKNLEEYCNLNLAEQYEKNSTLQASSDQLTLITLISCIRVMPMDSFIQTLNQVIKMPPAIHQPPVHLKIEVNALELFYFYMKSVPASQLADSWPSLLTLIRDGLSLIPPAQFILLMILNEFVQRCPQMPFQDKKDIRDLHDITSRLVDSLSNIAGSCLEQTTWLRRNLAVKEDITPMITECVRMTNGNSLQQYSVQAQSILSVILANLLDVAYGSQEKDKVVSIVTTLLYNITPYLRNHTTRNVASFYACSSLLASLSGYQYTRKAWRKDMMDLLLDNAFFQMDISCLPYWKQIMDSLMTYDNTTFRELMNRVSLTQTGSLNIFASREQEYEQRSMLLKRLAFVIFCSEYDQYQKYMPEIQEQLANSLRLSVMVPNVQAAVFLCFRVLLLRISPDHITSLWPIIITEMIQVFLSIEQELKTDSEDSREYLRMITGMDNSWPSITLNGLTSQSQMYYWRSVQLETAKLLELGCILPATLLPHFQMYRWAFVGSSFESTVVSDLLTDKNSLVLNIMTTQLNGYVPHVRRIVRLMDLKYPVHSPDLNIKRGQHVMLTCQQISTLQDLYGFFSSLNVTCPNPHNYGELEHDFKQCMIEIEEILSKDFLEKMPTNTTSR